jgi:hypothetical protein
MIAELQEKEIGVFDLVKGDFTTSDASEIVSDLIDKKINFHNVKNFSQEVRFNSEDQNSKQRILELKLAQEEAKNLIDKANKAGKSIRVNCFVSIEFV